MNLKGKFFFRRNIGSWEVHIFRDNEDNKRSSGFKDSLFEYSTNLATPICKEGENYDHNPIAETAYFFKYSYNQVPKVSRKKFYKDSFVFRSNMTILQAAFMQTSQEVDVCANCIRRFYKTEEIDSD